MKAETAKRVRAYLDDQRPAMVKLLERLVCAESPSRVPEAQQEVQAHLRAALEEAGLAVWHVPGRGRSGGHLYARPAPRRRKQRVQVLLGHSDTVWEQGTLKKMPFEVDGDEVRGPGVFDMKGGLVQLVFALKSLHALGLEPAVTPVVFINSDEEIGSQESRRYVERLARCADRALVVEPALGHGGRLKTARKGGGRFEVTVRGRSAHAGLEPESGASAIVELAHVIQRLHDLNDPERQITVNVGQIDGGVRANVVAPTSRAVVDVRVPTEEDARHVQEKLRNIGPTTPNTEVEIQGGFGRPPMERTPRNRTLWKAAQEAGRLLGLELEDGLAGGGSDGSYASQYTATLDGLGAVGDGAHAEHEFLYLDRMSERSALLALLLLLPPLPPPSNGAATAQTAREAVARGLEMAGGE